MHVLASRSQRCALPLLARGLNAHLSSCSLHVPTNAPMMDADSASVAVEMPELQAHSDSRLRSWNTDDLSKTMTSGQGLKEH